MELYTDTIFKIFKMNFFDVFMDFPEFFYFQSKTIILLVVSNV
jgi:hypothetical protein